MKDDDVIMWSNIYIHPYEDMVASTLLSSLSIHPDYQLIISTEI